MDIANLSKNQMRVLLAKDVLARIESKQIIASHQYFTLRNNYTYDDSTNVKIILENRDDVTCSVCALGSLLYSYVINFNNVKIYEVDYLEETANTIYNKLNPYFSDAEILAIEYFYEHRTYINSFCEINVKLTEKCLSLIDNYRYESTKHYEELDLDSYVIKLIMNNIIESEGESIFPFEIENNLI